MDQIVSEMVRVYSMFCIPMVIIDTRTGRTEIKTEWINHSAEEYYNNLSESLKYLQRKHSVVTHG